MAEREDDKISVLFVCLGNICRSTMAEGVFREFALKGPYSSKIDQIDSCGTAPYHVGQPPDQRTLSTLVSHDIDDYVHSGRMLCDADFDRFDYIFAMDQSNLADVQVRQQRHRRSRYGGGRAEEDESASGGAKVMLWGSYAGRPESKRRPEVVEDPYYGGRNGFDTVYRQCVRFSQNFLRETFPDVAGEEGAAEYGGAHAEEEGQ